MQLTKKQLEIMKYISSYQENHEGLSPTLDEIASEMGVCKITIFEHVEALAKKGALKKTKHFARSLEITAPEFMTRRGLPLLGRIAAGKPIEAIETPEQFELNSIVPPGADCYVLRVAGNSMIHDGIRDGDFVLVEKTADAHNGQTVVAIIGDGEATLKRFYREEGRIRLQPANDEMQPIYVDDCEIRGIVRGIVRRY